MSQQMESWILGIVQDETSKLNNPAPGSESEAIDGVAQRAFKE